MTAPPTPERLAEIRSALAEAQGYYSHTKPGAVGVVISAMPELLAEVDRLWRRVSKLEASFLLACKSRTRNREARLAAEAEVERLRTQVAAVEALCEQLEANDQGWRGMVNMAARHVPSVSAQQIRAALATGDGVQP